MLLLLVPCRRGFSLPEDHLVVGRWTAGKLPGKKLFI